MSEVLNHGGAQTRMDRRYFVGGSDARIIMGDDEAALLRSVARPSWTMRLG